MSLLASGTAVPSYWTDVSVQTLLRTYFVVGLAVALAAGLVLGVFVHRSPGAEAYASFPRRATRLGHVASVVLPSIAAAHAAMVDLQCGSVACAQAASALWVLGGLLLPIALLVAAARPRLVLVVPGPAVALVAAAVLFAVSWLTGGTS